MKNVFWFSSLIWKPKVNYFFHFIWLEISLNNDFFYVWYIYIRLWLAVNTVFRNFRVSVFSIEERITPRDELISFSKCSGLYTTSSMWGHIHLLWHFVQCFPCDSFVVILTFFSRKRIFIHSFKKNSSIFHLVQN